jgi:hypothetical protein
MGTTTAIPGEPRSATDIYQKLSISSLSLNIVSLPMHYGRISRRLMISKQRLNLPAEQALAVDRLRRARSGLFWCNPVPRASAATEAQDVGWHSAWFQRSSVASQRHFVMLWRVWHAAAPSLRTAISSRHALSHAQPARTMLHRLPNLIIHAHLARISSRHAQSYAQRLCACPPSENVVASCSYRMRTALAHAHPARMSSRHAHIVCALLSHMPTQPERDRVRLNRERNVIMRRAVPPNRRLQLTAWRRARSLVF